MESRALAYCLCPVPRSFRDVWEGSPPFPHGWSGSRAPLAFGAVRSWIGPTFPKRSGLMAGHDGPHARQDDVGPRQYFAGRFANDETGITQLIKVRGIKVRAQSKS